MPTRRVASQMLALGRNATPNAYICQSCLSKTGRHYTQSVRLDAGFEWTRRLKDTIFGKKSTGDKDADKTASVSTAKGKKAKRLSERRPLKRDGVTYTYADVVDPSEHRSYQPATTWKGLDRIGGEQWSKKQADGGEKYTGFLPRTQTTLTARQWKKLLHYTAIEIASLQKAGRDLNEISSTRAIDGKIVEQVLAMEDIKASSAAAECILSSASSESEHSSTQLLHLIAGESTGSDPSDAAVPAAFTAFGLSEPDVKLAFVKRIMQLTGKRIPDVTISKTNNLADLWQVCKAKEKPKAVFEAPQVQEMQSQVSNVAVYSSRRTPIHKDKAVGRWKVIKDELVARGLPVTGHRHDGMRDSLRFPRPLESTTH